jgi:hypothetical protein
MNNTSPTCTTPRRSSRLHLLIALACAIVSFPVLNLHAQLPRGVLFSDNFESATNVSPYTIAQQTATNSLATDSDPNNAQVGSWFTYGGEADGGPGLFGVQVTTNVDPSYTGTYQGTNVLRIFRSPVGSGSAACANFNSTQIGGKVRATWKQMMHAGANNYECMIHFSGTANPGGEGADTARVSLAIHPNGQVVYFHGGGWQAYGGVSLTLDKWQDMQLDVDLDGQTLELSIDGVSGGLQSDAFGFAPGNSAASMIVRGGGSGNDLFFVDQLQVFPLTKPIGAGHTPADGQRVETTTPVIYTLTDGFTPTAELVLNTNSIQLIINGSAVTPNLISKSGDTTTVQYLPPGGWTAETTNTVRLIYSDTNAPPNVSTNDFSFVVLPVLADTLPRQQADSPEGLIVLEAEHYDRKVASLETPLLFAMDWTLVTDPQGYSGDGAMQALPGENPNANLGSEVALQNSPRMDFKVRFLRTGTHYIWVRAYAPALAGGVGSHDSVHIGLDGNFLNNPITGFPDTSGNPAYNWSRTTTAGGTATMSPSVGYHYITVWMRENGFVIDKIVITSNPNYTPTGTGPAETPPGPDSSYWRAEESSGVVLDVDDDIPNPGSLLGTASRSNSVFAAVVPHTGSANTRSLNFTGTDGNAVNMGTNVNVATGDFTLQGWINARTIPGGSAFIAGEHITALFGNKGYELFATTSGGGYTVGASISAGGTVVTATSGALTLGQWYHVAAVRGGGTLKLYVDGVQAASVTDTIAGQNLDGAQNFSIGGAREGDGNYHKPFDGLVDEVRITLAALTPSQFLNALLPTRPTIQSRIPAPDATGVAANTNIVIRLQDGTIQVVTNTIQLRFNSVLVSPTITQSNTTTIITYDPPGDLGAGSLNTVQLIFTDNGAPAQTTTNTYSFRVAYVPISVASYWRFEEASGSTALDSTGPFPGTLSSNAIRSAEVPVTPVPQTGAANTKSMSFDGTGAPSTVGTAVDMGPSIQVVSNDFTLECYVKVTGTPNAPAIVVGKLQTGLFSDKFFSINHSGQTAGQISFTFAMTGGNSVSTGLKNLNQWYHVAGVRQGTAIRVYVDGVLENSGTLNSFQDFTSDQRFCVAGGASGGIANMQGLVDEVRLSPSALAPALFLNAPPAAILNFSRSGNQLTLSWTASGFVLQENSNLQNAAGWSNVPGGNVSPVIITMNAAPKFYRLIK